MQSKQVKILAIPIRNQKLYFFVQKKPAIDPKQQIIGAAPLNLKFRLTVDKYSDKMVNKWEEWGQTKDQKSFKYRVYKFGNQIIDKIDSDEWFLKELSPVHTNNTQILDYRFMIHAPSNVPQSEVQSRIDNILSERLKYHQRYKRLSLLGVPFSLFVGFLLPGPNLLLAYNLFRLYSHDKALYGGQFLKQRLDGIAQDEKLTSILEQQEAVESKLEKENLPVQSKYEVILNEFDMSDTFLHNIRRGYLQSKDQDQNKNKKDE